MRKILFFSLVVFLLSFSFVQAARTESTTAGSFFSTSPVSATSIYYSGGYTGFGTSNPTSQVTVQGIAGTTTPTFNTASSTGQSTFSVSSTGVLSVVKYQGFGVPTIATSTGLGATSTASVNGTDLAGIVFATTTLSTAAQSPQASSTLFTITWASTTSAYCVFSPANATSTWLNTPPYIVQTATGFSLVSGAAPIASTTYAWTYHCN